MDNNEKLELAVDIMSSVIASAINSGYDAGSDLMKMLVYEREQMYSQNEKVIDKIINVYGKELKNKR